MFYISMIGNGYGNIGNRAFMYMYAKILQMKYMNDSEVVNFSIPDLDIYCPDKKILGRVLHINGGHEHSMNTLGYFYKKRIYDAIQINFFSQRMEYYPSSDFCSSLFPRQIQNNEIADDEILISVRGKEILGAIHEDYVPIPIDFIVQVIKETGLKPVFVGQIGDDFYSQELICRIPNARLIENSSAQHDFNLIRNAKNVLLSISTFTWIASWISRTNKNIYMPVFGLFHPVQRADIDLLPIGDSRYHFYELPIFKWRKRKDEISYILGKGKNFQKLSHLDAARKISYSGAH